MDSKNKVIAVSDFLTRTFADSIQSNKNSARGNSENNSAFRLTDVARRFWNALP